MSGNIHLKIERPEALAIKKDMLLLEKSFLEAATHIRNYEVARKKEFILKKQMQKAFSAIENEINSIEALLPEEKMETIEIKKLGIKSKKSKTSEGNRDLIEQLREIQDRLAQLG